MKRILVLAAVCLSLPAAAQITPFEIGVGWGQSGSFTKDTGGRGRLEGVELTLSQSLLKLPFVGEARLGVSALLSGQLGIGDDLGNVYRLFAQYHTPSFGPQGFYGIVGMHFAHAEGANGAFDNVNASGIDLGLGIPLGAPAPLLPKTAIEVVNHQNSKSQLRGWSVTFLIRL